MNIPKEIRDFADEMTAWRRDIHAHPETALEEVRTSAIVAEKLRAWGLEVTTGVGGTGVIGTLRNGNSNRTIGLRADMDALPMSEENNFAHRSQNEGAMHACGHDGHTTMLLGAARYLATTKNFSGTVHFIFQPAEEGAKGAPAMIRDGLFERFPCDHLFAFHNDPNLPIGTAFIRRGVINANSDRFMIKIIGCGGHASKPDIAIDPIIIGTQIVSALQTIVSRRTSPLDCAVVSVCEFHAGSVGNVIPAEAVLRGSVRTLKGEVQDAIERRMEKLVRQIAEANDATVEFTYTRLVPQVINSDAPTDTAYAASDAVLGVENVTRDGPIMMGGEDFSYMSRLVPSCFIRLGQGAGEATSMPLHHPAYDFNDDLSPIGATLWSKIVESELPKHN